MTGLARQFPEIGRTPLDSLPEHKEKHLEQVLEVVQLVVQVQGVQTVRALHSNVVKRKDHVLQKSVDQDSAVVQQTVESGDEERREQVGLETLLDVIVAFHDAGRELFGLG